MSLHVSTDGSRSPARLHAVARLFGDLRGWFGEEIHAIRTAQLDDAFFATAKGMQYRPAPGAAGSQPSAA